MREHVMHVGWHVIDDHDSPMLVLNPVAIEEDGEFQYWSQFSHASPKDMQFAADALNARDREEG